MVRILLLLAVLLSFAIAGCAREAVPTPTSLPAALGASPTPGPPTLATAPTSTLAAPAPTLAPPVATFTQPPARPTPLATPSPAPVAQALFLEVSEPEDGDEVAEGTVEVMGRTIPDAVVSVNGELVDLDETGSFSLLVELEDGPNIIEVVASDFEGNEASVILAVIYSP